MKNEKATVELFQKVRREKCVLCLKEEKLSKDSRLFPNSVTAKGRNFHNKRVNGVRVEREESKLVIEQVCYKTIVQHTHKPSSCISIDFKDLNKTGKGKTHTKDYAWY